MRRRYPYREVELRPGLTAQFVLRPDEHGRTTLARLVLDGERITSEDLRRVSVRSLAAAATSRPARPIPLSRPDRSNPQAFYENVAEHYRWHAAGSRRPAADMAEAASVPVGTVHRWIREARQRGCLPQARQGAVG